MQPFTNRARQVGRGLFFVTTFTLALHFGTATARADCITPANEIEAENCLPGNPQSEWDVTGAGDPTIQGFATDISFDQGQTVQFKVKTTAAAFHIDIYRLGWYGGAGARKVHTIADVDTVESNQVACLDDELQPHTTRIVDCGNWSVSASWAIPAPATSGIYIARLVRGDTLGASHVVFIVRDDNGNSDLLFQTADTTWQAYNRYGGKSLYFPDSRAYKVSYNRPFTTREVNSASWLFGPEYAMVRWLERNGYDVSYFTGMDSDRRGAELLDHKIFLSVGHDEYWSAAQRTNVEAARDNALTPVDLAFFAGNDVFWKVRWENNYNGTYIDSTSWQFNGPTPYRTLVCYKESTVKLDPMAGMWTGTWRDPRLQPPAHDGGRPENELTGTLFMVNIDGTTSMDVPAADGKLRFWRDTTVATLPAGGVATLPFGVLGYEWNEDVDNGLRPAGQIRLSTSVRSGMAYLYNFGSFYTAETATHHMTLHRKGQALVFSAGTIQWAWGLDSNHDSGVSLPSQIPAADIRMQQATVNLFADMGVQPWSIQSGLVASTVSLETIPPTSTITSPTAGATLPSGTQITITGTAVDGGGVVGGVEVSTDGGTTWHPAVGRESWSYKWTPTATGSVTIRSRASDDSLNLETPSGGVGVTIGAPAPINCPCSIWSPSVPVGPDSDDAASVNLGVKFRSDIDGFITGIRFYKHPGNTGTHTAFLFSADGTQLASATFSGESASGWQEATLIPSVAVTANTTYVVSYHAPNGHYAATRPYFDTGVDNPPLHALAEHVDGSNGVFAYGAAGAFPTGTFAYSNYWVDVVFDTTAGSDTTPPAVTSTSPAAGATGVAPSANVEATFTEAMDVATINTSTFELRDPLNNPLPASVSFTTATKTATLNPTSQLAASTTYTATVKGGPLGAKDLAGNALAVDHTWTFTTGGGAGCPCSLWNNDSSIVGSDLGDPNAVNLGMKFHSDLDGYIKGIRFYRHAGNTVANTGYLWTRLGVQLATVTFPATTVPGWQEVTFSAPVPISANTTYVGSYHTPVGHFAATPGYFATEHYVPPLRALASGVDGSNGVFVYGAAGFPTDATMSNYWVDVVFDTTVEDLTPPIVTSRSPVNGATIVSTATNVTATFNESMNASTINTATFELRDGGNNLVGAAVTYDDATKTATLDPSALLSNSMTYTATIRGGATGVKDVAGNPLVADQSWSFTTAAAPPTFTAGADVTVLEDSGTYNNTWATNITGGPVVFLVSTDNNALFGTAPAISPAGALTFTPAANVFGAATVTVVATNSEGTTSSPVSFLLTITGVNDAPSFTAGGNVEVAEDSGQYNAVWATGVSAGPSESSQAVSFIVSNDNAPLFAVPPAISPAGVLTFTPALNANSTTTVTVRLQDDGGIANGGVNTTGEQTFTIRVTAVNDAPSFTKGADSRLLDTAGAQTVTGWATNLNAGTLDEAGLLLNFIVSNDNNALFSAQPQITSSGTLNFTPAVGQGGVAIVSVRIHDDGGTVNGGVDTSAPQTFTITVDNIPVITSGNATTFTVGIAGTFTVTTTGAPRPTITRGGVTLPSGIAFVDNGDGTGTLSGTPASETSGTYAITFTATNVAGSTAPQSFTFTINQAPAITSANSTAFTAGTAGSFIVTTTGFPAPSISLGGVALPSGITFTDNGNGTATLSGTAATGTGGTYAISFTATNLVTSTPAQSFALTINEAPVITASPANQTICAGSTATFTATAGGFPAPTVQWQVSGDGTTYTDIPGAVSSTLTFMPVVADNGKQYRAVFTNSSATATTSAAILTVNATPEATITPAAAAVCASSTGNTAQGPAGAATYAWTISNGTITSGQNERTVTFTAGATATTSLTLTVTNAAGCSATNTAPVAINELPATPTITAGASTSFCAGESVTLTSSSATGNQWFLNGIAISGATDDQHIVSASGDYSLAVTNNGCSSAVSEATTVTVNAVPAAPSITAEGTTTFCQGGNVTLTSSSASGNQWFLNGVAISGATGAQHIATGSGDYTVAATSGACSSATSSATTVMVNSVPAAPTVTAGGSTTFCAGGSVTLTSSSASGNQWHLNGSPISGATNATYAATATGSYTVIATANGCPSAPSAATPVTVNAVPATPTISAGGDTTFCEGGSVTLTSSSASGNQWYLNGSPISGATNATYAANATGNYTVIASPNGCPSAASGATAVTVNAAPATPSISAGGDTTFCEGGSVTLTSSSASGNQWYLNGSPISGATNTTYAATATGNYTVIATANGCPSAPSAGTAVTVNAAPATPTISGPTTFCQGGSVTLTSSSTTGNQWYLNGSPIGAATNATYLATATGNYTVIATANGCPSEPSAATAVTVNAAPVTPTISAGGSTTFCEGGSVTLTSSSASGNQWYLNGSPISGATNTTYAATATGNYTVIATANGCPSAPSAGTAVTVNAAPVTPTISAGGPTTFCEGGSVTLTSSSASGNQWSLNGSPISAATNSTYIATATGNYTVIATGNGCPSAPSAATAVTVNAVPVTPTISAGGATTFCEGGSVTLTSSSASGNQWYLNGSPIGAATNATYLATATGNYTVIATANGCPSTASAATTLTVTQTPTPTISAGGPTTFCTGGSVTLTSSSPTGNQWSLNGVAIGGATNPTYLASAAGNYTVIATANGCPSTASAATAVTVTQTPTPTISAGGPTTFCTGGSVTLTSSSPTGNQWSLNGVAIGGATNPTYLASAAGNYTVIATANGCPSVASTATTVTVNANPATPMITAPSAVNANSVGNTASGPAGATTYSWSIVNGSITSATSGQSITFTAGATGNVTLNLVVTNATGCSATNSALVTINANQAPIAGNDSANLLEGGTLTVAAPGVLINDNDPEGSTLTAIQASGPAYGALTFSANGSFTYTHNGSETTSDSFTYRAFDGVNYSNVATVSISVAPVNDSPVAVNDSYSTAKDTALIVAAAGVLANDTDPDNVSLTASVISNPAHGTLTLNPNGGFTYTPVTGYLGGDTFTYQASDGTAPSNTATVSITVYAESVTQVVPAGTGGTVTTDSEADGATPTDPVETTVTVPAGVAGGAVTIEETNAIAPAPTGYTFFNQVNITAPAATAENPLVIKFRMDASVVPAGQTAETIQLFRNGVLVPNCTPAVPVAASPDPCIASRVLLGDGDIELTARTSTASYWNCGFITPTAVMVSINDVTVTETDSGTVNATFLVTLDTASTATVTVNYATADSTAVAPGDYTAGSGTLTFPPGTISKSVTISVNGDLLDEADEMFAINLTAPTNATISDAQGLCTINDNDAVPAITIGDLTVSEGASGSAWALFPVTLSAPSGRTVTVNYATADSTTTAGEDYFVRSSTLTFPAGTTSMNAQVQVRGDTKYEDDEVFVVNLSAPVNATLGTKSQSSCTVVNDDSVPSFSINDISITEGNAGTTNAIFTIKLSNSSENTITVSYATANNTAVAPDDYLATSGTLTYAPGQTSKTVWVVIKGDTATEANEILNMDLSNAANATIADNTGQCTILNDD